MDLRPLVIKLGGAALSSKKTLDHFFNEINQYRALSTRPLVIVHGGGMLVDEALKNAGFKSEKKRGLRVTPSEQIPLVVGALAGTANKFLQSCAIKNGIKAVGLSLADGDLCTVCKAVDTDLGCVGSAAPNNPQFLQLVLERGYLPIISSIGISAYGEMLNVNADQGAVAVAGALDGELVILSDVSGVLDEKGILMSSLDEQKAKQLIANGVIADGMVVKVNAAFEAAKSLGRAIEISSWRNPETLHALFSGSNVGTRFTV